MNDSAGRVLGTADLQQILLGATFLGSGGGGPISLGQAMVTQLSQLASQGYPVTLVPAAALPADEEGAIIAGVGSPDAAANGFPLGALTAAWDRLGSPPADPLTFVLPAELGAGNSFIPFLLAAQQRLPVVDCAGASRAVPGLSQVTYDTPSTPVGEVVLTDATTWVEYSTDTTDHADEAMRLLMSGTLFAEVAGAALWRMTGDQVRATAITGTTTQMQAVGAALQDPDPSARIPKATSLLVGGEVVVAGQIVKVDQSTGGGFDHGQVVIQDSSSTAQYTVMTINENLAVLRSDPEATLFVAPDLLCYALADGTPFSNAEVNDRMHQDMVLVRCFAAPQMYEPHILAGFDALLTQCGLKGPFTHTPPPTS
ncbi:MAG: DUF917 family protein [Candidatus Nanopelagicales bacterium]